VLFFNELAKNNLLPEGFIDMYKKMNISEEGNVNIIDKEIEQWIIYDVGKVIKICKDNGIKIILLDYPSREKASDILYNIAKVNSVPFVGNYHKFKGLLDKGSIEAEYFAPDEHCNTEGYALMARNIFDKIVQEQMFEF
jgi:hypothetical protein